MSARVDSILAPDEEVRFEGRLRGLPPWQGTRLLIYLLLAAALVAVPAAMLGASKVGQTPAGIVYLLMFFVYVVGVAASTVVMFLVEGWSGLRWRAGRLVVTDRRIVCVPAGRVRCREMPRSAAVHVERSRFGWRLRTVASPRKISLAGYDALERDALREALLDDRRRGAPRDPVRPLAAARS